MPTPTRSVTYSEPGKEDFRFRAQGLVQQRPLCAGQHPRLGELQVEGLKLDTSEREGQGKTEKGRREGGGDSQA